MTTYQKRMDLTVEEADKEVYVQGNEGGWFVLRGTAKALWGALDVPRTPDDLIQLLSEKYEGDRDQIASDLQMTLNEWSEQNLVTAVDQS